MTAVYVALTCLATLSVPDGYANWREYVANIAHYRGVEGIPTFNAAKCAMGSAGLALLGLAVVATIASSLLGFMRATSRLVSTLAEDGLLPKALGHLEKDGTPRNAIYALMALSIGIPFFGRTAISWVADITAISVSLVYLLTSACCWVLAKESGNRRIKISGLCGMGIATTVFLFSLVPNLWNSNTLAKESYLLLVAWCLLGVGAYLLTMWRRRQHERKQSPLLWIIMLFLLFFSVGVWAKSIVYEAIKESAREIARINALELNTGLR
ncbi:MAG: amino acid permease [Desulfovibrionaceae bacterium]|nr:amino acid permease [Desulfovibrionaceae bacterium]